MPQPELENSEMQNDDIVPEATVIVPEAEELIAPGTPIQFDIVLPATEFLHQNPGSRLSTLLVRLRMTHSQKQKIHFCNRCS